MKAIAGNSRCCPRYQGKNLRATSAIVSSCYNPTMAMTLDIQDRIIDFRRVPASSLIPHPRNWRRHPTPQMEAWRGILAEIGFVGALIVREIAAGLQLIDGHLRASTLGDQLVPVLVCDLDDDETNYLLGTHDPLAAMAEKEENTLLALREDIDSKYEAVNRMLDDLVNGDQLGGLQWGEEIDESIADGVSLCNCPACGHEHHAVSK